MILHVKRLQEHKDRLFGVNNKPEGFLVDPMMTAKHIVFHGRVQGVGFRYTSLRIAAGYELTGFVRNLPDRTVEMLAQGTTREIDNCLRDIQEYFGGHIKDCVTKEIPYNPRYTDFRISY